MSILDLKIIALRYGFIMGIGLAMALPSQAHVVDQKEAAVASNEKIVVPNSGGVATIRSNTPIITRQQVRFSRGSLKLLLEPLNFL